MEATEKRLTPPLRRMLGTRSGTLALAAGVAVLAAIVLVAFLAQYRDSVRGGTAPTTALVAGSLIPKGTSGDVVIGEKLFRPTTLPEEEVKGGALVDTQAIAGKVALRDIYPGQQLTAADFAAKADPVRGKLTGDQRAVALELDTSHGLVNELRRGDRVDVMVSLGANGVRDREATVRTLMQNVLVLAVPDAEKEIDTGKSADVMVRVTDKQAAELAYAAENGKVWFALRPPAGASEQQPANVDLNALGSNR